MAIDKRTGDFPKRVEIEFSNSCNLRCVSCPRRFKPEKEGSMSMGLYKKIIDESKNYPGTVLQLHRKGESLLHPDFIEMLEYIKGKFKSVQLATNATVLDKEKAKIIAETVSFLSFSIDLPESYPKKKGENLYGIVEKNITEFIKINKGAKIQVSMIKDKSTTEDDIQKFRHLWADKVDRVRIYEEHSADGRYGSVCIERDPRLPCIKPFTDMVIYWDGRVVRCNHDWSNAPLGNVNTGAVSQIWQSSEYERIRREQLSLSFTEEMCKHCGSWYPEEGKQQTGFIFTSV